MRLQAGPLVHFTILSKKTIVAGAVEGAVCTMPLDKTTHMGTGSRERTNVPLYVTIFLDPLDEGSAGEIPAG